MHYTIMCQTRHVKLNSKHRITQKSTSSSISHFQGMQRIEQHRCRGELSFFFRLQGRWNEQDEGILWSCFTCTVQYYKVYWLKIAPFSLFPVDPAVLWRRPTLQWHSANDSENAARRNHSTGGTRMAAINILCAQFNKQVQHLECKPHQVQQLICLV